MLDYEYHRFKSCAAGIIHGVVNDQLAVAAHGVDLLQTAVATAHTGSHDDQIRFFLHVVPPTVCPVGRGCLSVTNKTVNLIIIPLYLRRNIFFKSAKKAGGTAVSGSPWPVD